MQPLRKDADANMCRVPLTQLGALLRDEFPGSTLSYDQIVSRCRSMRVPGVTYAAGRWWFDESRVAEIGAAFGITNDVEAMT